MYEYAHLDHNIITVNIMKHSIIKSHDHPPITPHTHTHTHTHRNPYKMGNLSEAADESLHLPQESSREACTTPYCLLTLTTTKTTKPFTLTTQSEVM